jgi:hypothetical protein
VSGPFIGPPLAAPIKGEKRGREKVSGPFIGPLAAPIKVPDTFVWASFGEAPMTRHSCVSCLGQPKLPVAGPEEADTSGGDGWADVPPASQTWLLAFSASDCEQGI